MTIYCYMHSPPVVFRAQVHLPTTPQLYPAVAVIPKNITFGTVAGVKVGQTIWLGSAMGLNDKGRQRISRLGGTPSFFLAGLSAYGNHDGELMIEEDTYITILDDHRVWAKIPLFFDDGHFQKDGRLDPTGNGQEGGVDNPPPIANGGAPFAATINPSTHLITVHFDAHDSIDFGIAIDTPLTIPSFFAWDVGDGTITSGTTGSQAITATFPAGFRYVSLTAFSSGGATHTTYIPVFARDPANDVTIKHQITNHQKTPQGQEITLRILQALPRETYPDGTMVILFDGEPSGPSDRSNILFYGWHQSDAYGREQQRTATLMDFSMVFFDVAKRLTSLPAFSQRLERNAIPTTWYDCMHPTMFHYLWYLLHWHSTALEVADLLVNGGFSTLHNFKFLTMSSQQDNLYAQAERLCAGVTPDHHLCCNQQGQLNTVPDPFLLDTGSRGSWVVVVDAWDDADWTQVSLEETPPPRVNQIRSRAVQSTTAYVVVDGHDTIPTVASLAPGVGRGQGPQDIEVTDHITQSQFDLNVCEGNRYARLNSRYGRVSVTLPYAAMAVGNDPGRLQWIQIYLKEYAGFVSWIRDLPAPGGFNALCSEMTISYDYSENGWTRTVQATLEIETSGPAAETLPGG